MAGAEADMMLAELGVVPSGAERIARLYRGEGDGTGLLVIDLLTIRDLLRHAGEGAQKSAGAHALLVAMFLAVREGNLSLRLDESAVAARLTGYMAEESAREFAKEALSSAGQIEELIVDGDGGALVGERYRPIVRTGMCGNARVYFHRYFAAERAIREGLSGRRRALIELDQEAARRALAEVMGNPARVRSIDRVLNEDQKRAVVQGMARKLTVVSGGPGTGKTSIVLALLRCLSRVGVEPARMVLAAPTGRAAQRMAASVRTGLGSLKMPATAEEAALGTVAASTLHRLLGYSPRRGTFYRNAENPIEADVVVVDECSMADATIMAALLEALPNDSRLILLGDKDQLPSVQAGAVLAGLLPEGASEQDGVVVLTKNYRSEKGIVEAAAAINGGDIGIVDRMAGAMSIGEAMKPGQAAALMDESDVGIDELLAGWTEICAEGGSTARWLEELSKFSADDPAAREVAALALRELDRFRILTVTREGMGGSVDINARLVRMARQRAGEWASGTELIAGLPVMATANDPTRGIFNGDMGLCARDREGNLVVWMDLAEGAVAMGSMSVPGLEVAFAVTVHKGQGSEYENVLLMFPPETGAEMHRLLTRQIVYTAITRARGRVVIRAKAEALKAAIGRPMLRDSPSLWG